MSKIMRELYREAINSRQAPTVGKRYSTDPGDPGFPNYQGALLAGRVLAVTVDGVKVEYCKTADECSGVAICFEKPLKLKSGRIAQVEHRGVVRVEFVDAP